MSTLLQYPAGQAKVEEPMNLCIEGAGFVFLKIEREKDS